MTGPTSWFYWAILSAVFAAMTAIFAKIGIQGVDSDRQVDKPVDTAGQNLAIFDPIWAGHWGFVGLLLSGPANRRGLQGGASGQAQLGAGRSLCICLFGRAAFAARMVGHCDGRGRRFGAGHQTLTLQAASINIRAPGRTSALTPDIPGLAHRCAKRPPPDVAMHLQGQCQNGPPTRRQHQRFQWGAPTLKTFG
jgi:hypothetical protein